MKKLYLHIGVHRTATSSLQRFLFSNAERLSVRGVIYPLGVERQQGAIDAIFWKQKTVAEVVEDIEREVATCTSEVHSVVMSDEDISKRADLSLIAQFKDFYDVRIVVFLRRQDLWLESWYLQNIKWQWDPELAHVTLDEFMARRADFHWIDYDAYLTHIENLFGRENVRVQVFEPENMPDGVYAELCRLLDLGDATGLPVPGELNHSLTPLISEFMRTLPLGESPAPVREKLEAACISLDAELRRTHPDLFNLKEKLLTAKQRRDVLAQYKAGNLAIAERYFGRKDLFRAKMPEDDAPIATLRLPADSYEYTQLIVEPFVRHLANLVANSNEK